MINSMDIDHWMDEVESNIAALTAHPYGGTPVGDVLDWATASGGKRIRPRLLLISAMFGDRCGEQRERLTLLAAMVEVTHLASLIHDDIVDEAPYRRDRQSVQAKFGKHAAVYAGDFLMARIQYFQAKEKLSESGMVLSGAIEQMCAGEIGQSMCRWREDVTMQEYLCNIRGKTTALFEAACRIGAMEGGCDGAVIDKLDQFGACLGEMFQLRDDLMDFTADTSCAGKETHKDFRDGIYTMPVLLAMRDPEAKERLIPIMRVNRDQELSEEQIREMERIVQECGGVEATRREIRRHAERCAQILGELPETAASAALYEILKQLQSE